MKTIINQSKVREIKVVDGKTNNNPDHPDYGKFKALDIVRIECMWQGYGWKITEPMNEKYPQYKGQIFVDLTFRKEKGIDKYTGRGNGLPRGSSQLDARS